MCFKSDLRIYLFCGDFECLLLLKIKNKNSLQVLIIVHNNAFINICSISVWGMSWKCCTLIQKHACRHFEFCINKPELYRNFETHCIYQKLWDKKRTRARIIVMEMEKLCISVHLFDTGKISFYKTLSRYLFSLLFICQ